MHVSEDLVKHPQDHPDCAAPGAATKDSRALSDNRYGPHGTPEVPFDETLCPITREPMEKPVIAADGYTYEEENIQQWCARHVLLASVCTLRSALQP